MSKLLVISEGDRKGRKVEFDKPEIHIGRDPVCELALEDGLASRKHAVITSNDTGVRIQDLKSRNGTWVNGASITACALEHGDVIKIGNTSITFKLKELEVAASDFTPVEDAELDHFETITLNTQDLFVSEESPNVAQSPNRATAALKSLYEAGQIINSVLNADELLQQVVELVFQSLAGADQCFIFLVNEETGELEFKTGRGKRGEEIELMYHFTAPIMESVLKRKQALLTYDVMADERLTGQSQANRKINSVICAPLQTRDKIWGIIQANTLDSGHKLMEEDLRLLASIGLHAGSSLENARLFEALNEETKALQEANKALKKAQDKLMQNERMAAVGALAAGVVHDIQTPLAVIQGYHRLIHKELEAGEEPGIDLDKLKQCTDGLAEGINRSSEVLQSLLDFADPAEGDREEHDVNQLMEDTLSFLKSQISGCNTQVVRHLEEDLPTTLCDASQIKRVFVNIIMNALQAMETRGELGLSSGLINRQDRAYIAMRIRDNGPGMPEEVQRKVFDPFFSTKGYRKHSGSGTGLGLSISYNIIQQHEGIIEVKSEPGTGTVFTIYLPASQNMPSGGFDRTMAINLDD